IGFPGVESRGRRKLSSRKAGITVHPETSAPGLRWNRWVESIPAVQLKSYGGPAGVLTLSMDGGPATHLKLLIDGFELTNPQNGLTDLSQLPLALITTLNYIPSGPGNEAMSSDGALHLQTGIASSQALFSTGSYGHQSWSGSVSFRKRKIQGVVRLGSRRDDGNFPVTYRGQTGKRSNNDFRQRFFQGSLHGIHNATRSSRFFGLWTGQDRGVAGLIYSPSQGRHTDHLLLVGWEHIFLTGTGVRKTQLSYQGNRDRYDDPDLLIHSQHDNRKISLKWEDRQELNTIGSLTHRIETEDQILRSTDAGRRRRRTGLLVSRWDSPEKREFHLGFSGSILAADGYRREIQSQANAGIDFPKPFSGSIQLTSGKEARIPTFNELYWSPGGNPDLKPEHTRYTQLELSFTTRVLGSLRWLAFSKTSYDLIQWTPRGSLWQPVNIQKVARTGWKIRWSRTQPFLHFSPSLTYGVVRAVNLSSGEVYRKQLPYVPVHTGSLALTWSFRDWKVTVTRRYRGSMISRYDWPRDIRLPGVRLGDLAIEKTWTFRRITLIAGFNLDNLTNVSYETVQGYPEPGRSALFTLTLQPYQEN
ncbi:MAG: hypothetical protein ACE5D1_01615, partial [Fidelibacterota bacterium]